jgi:hypothetical protein
MSREMKNKSSFVTFFWVLVVVSMLYVLSIGPVGMLSTRSGSRPAPIMKIYVPVFWLHDNTPFGKPIDAYLKIWGSVIYFFRLHRALPE